MTDRLITGLDAAPASLHRCCLAIGNFDGVHLGHQQIIATAGELGRKHGRPVVAVTFQPPPEMVLRPAVSPQRIVLHERKCHLLLEAGADYVVTAAADQALLEMPAKQFVEQIIVRRFNASHIVEGQDFHFGAKRSGDVSLLGLLGFHFGFAVHVVNAVQVDFSKGLHGGQAAAAPNGGAELPHGPQRISSTLIRRLILDGHVGQAAQCMGRPFEFVAPVIAGQGQGRLLDFPTINLPQGQQVTPGDGVYAGVAIVESSRKGAAPARYAAAISIGAKPTLGTGPERFIEAFLLDASGDFYGREVCLVFLARLRDQQKFSGPDALKQQIALDVKQTRQTVNSVNKGTR